MKIYILLISIINIYVINASVHPGITITMYQDADFKGKSAKMTIYSDYNKGTKCSNLKNEYNDWGSSLTYLGLGFEYGCACMHENGDCKGMKKCWRLTGGDVGEINYFGNLNDKVSSFSYSLSTNC